MMNLLRQQKMIQSNECCLRFKFVAMDFIRTKQSLPDPDGFQSFSQFCHSFSFLWLKYDKSFCCLGWRWQSGANELLKNKIISEHILKIEMGGGGRERVSCTT